MANVCERRKEGKHSWLCLLICLLGFKFLCYKDFGD